MIYLQQNIERIAAKIKRLEDKLPETTGKLRHYIRYNICYKKRTLRRLEKLSEYGVIYNKNNKGKQKYD